MNIPEILVANGTGIILVGFLWCLFVDFRIYRSTRRLHRKILTLGIPLHREFPQ